MVRKILSKFLVLVAMFLIWFGVSMFVFGPKQHGQELIRNAHIATIGTMIQHIEIDINNDNSGQSVKEIFENSYSEYEGNFVESIGGEILLEEKLNHDSINEYVLVIQGKGENKFILSPYFADYLDRKMDDGLPKTGRVLAEGTSECFSQGNGGKLIYKTHDNPCLQLFIKLRIKK